jgi:hypothetical protein
MIAIARRAGRVAAVAGLALVFTACERTTVSRILAEPSRYAQEEVGLQGRVLKSASVLGKGAYQLDDGTGVIWVVSGHGVPRQGARVKVRGRVRDVVDLGTLVVLPPEVGSGLVLEESEHRAW